MEQTCETLRAEGDKIQSNQTPDIKARLKGALPKMELKDSSFMGVLAENPTIVTPACCKSCGPRPVPQDASRLIRRYDRQDEVHLCVRHYALRKFQLRRQDAGSAQGPRPQGAGGKPELMLACDLANPKWATLRSCADRHGLANIHAPCGRPAATTVFTGQNAGKIRTRTVRRACASCQARPEQTVARFGTILVHGRFPGGVV
jgi:hypothetical protein